MRLHVSPPAGALTLVTVVTLTWLATSVTAQLSKPIAHDHAVTKGADGEERANKFLARKASPDSFDDEEALHPQDECPANLELRWMTEVTSSIYSTPIITDLFSDGHKEVVVPSFVHYLEVLEGEDGAKAGGDWPAFHKSTVHASPITHDTADGTEILLPMYDGEVHFYNDHGEHPSQSNKSDRGEKCDDVMDDEDDPRPPPPPICYRWHPRPSVLVARPQRTHFFNHGYVTSPRPPSVLSS